MENKSELIIYTTEDGLTKVDVTFDQETVWLSKSQIGELFQRDRSVISKHIKNVFEEGELPEIGNVQNLHVAGSDKPIAFYSLDVIISIGYRVKSRRGVQFRIWATNVLKEYMKKGFALDDERLKGSGGGNYWKELLERIRDIRSSEKMLYRQVLDLYATAVDYDPHSSASVTFFSIVQNKLHYAAHGHTAAEIIYQRADANQPFMGLRSFSGEMPLRKDIAVAKNYLTEAELKVLNNLVSGYFDIAEINAIEHRPMYMEDYIRQLDAVLTSGNRKLLEGSGSVSHLQALEKANAEYRKYQAENLSPVETEYLKTIKATEKLAKRQSRNSEG